MFGDSLTTKNKIFYTPLFEKLRFEKFGNKKNQNLSFFDQIWHVRYQIGVFKVAESNFILKIRLELGLIYYEGKQCEACYWSYGRFSVIAGLKWRSGENKRKINEDKRKTSKAQRTIHEDKKTKNEDGMTKSNVTLCAVRNTSLQPLCRLVDIVDLLIMPSNTVMLPNIENHRPPFLALVQDMTLQSFN